MSDLGSVRDEVSSTVARRGEELGGRMERGGLKVSRAIHDKVLQGGEPARKFADLLHGTWLGHPLHPVLTDATIGAFVYGATFDAIGSITGDRRTQWAADRLTAIGTISALPTAVAGVAEFSTVPKGAAGKTATHALLNGAALGLYMASLNERRRGRRRRGVLFSALALGTNLFSAWLGGHLVYRDRVGVDHSEHFTGPRRWTSVLPAAELGDGQTRRVEFDGKGVLLHRTGTEIHAIGAVCSHAGGPLEEGEVRGCTVQCPWHDSVFDLRDGSIVHGPATSPQAGFDARLQGDRIEIRLAN